MATRGIGDILNKLQRVKAMKGYFMASCPAHDDKKASLSVKQEGDKILINCHAGCETENIVKAMNLEMTDLFIKQEQVTTATNTKGKIVAEYNYQDETGKVIYQVVRFDPKNFLQRRRNGHEDWVWNMDGVRRVLYHLPEILTSYEETIYHVEGEKDADNLIGWGRVATTSPGGANAWRSEYANAYAGKRVVVIPDKDSAGFGYAKQVIRSVVPLAREVKVIILPDGFKDVSDWLNGGNDVEQLAGMEQDVSILLDPEKPEYKLVEDTITWQKQVDNKTLQFFAEKVSEERTGVHAKISMVYDFLPLAWGYFNIERSEDRTRLANQAHKQMPDEATKSYAEKDLRRDMDAFCAGLWDFRLSTFVPELMEGDPTLEPISFMLSPYVLEGGGTILFAPPGRGKSYTALLWSISIDAGVTKFWPVKQNRVMFINLERSRESLKRRVASVNRVLGLPPERPILTLNARGKSLNDVLPVCRKYIKQYGVKVVVLDSISRAGYGDLNENQPVNRIIDALSSLSPTWIALAHTSRANEEHAYGSIMLDAGADVCVLLATELKEDGTLGLGYQITKQNDVGNHNQCIFALEFNECGLKEVRKAKIFEFPDIEGKKKQSPITTIIEYIEAQDSKMADATTIANDTGLDRTTVSRYLSGSGKFTKITKGTKNILYGVKY